MNSEENVSTQIWKLETDYWDYLKAGDLENYSELWHDDVVAWPNKQDEPLSKFGVLKMVEGILNLLDQSTINIDLIHQSTYVARPDTAVIHYSVMCMLE